MQYELRIFGLIGPRGVGDTCALQLQDEIDSMQLTARDTLVVRISSPGGYCSEARAMYGMLRNLPCRTVALIEGDAMQCASFVAMSCETIRAMSHALIGLAEPWACAQGNAAQLSRVADCLDVECATMIGAYAYATRQSAGTIAVWMTDNEGEGTTFTAADALKVGLVDELVLPDGSIRRRDDDDEETDEGVSNRLRAHLNN